MSNIGDRYDDGLVHNHGWATEKPVPGLGRTPSSVTPRPAPSADEPYDDGLVHDHGWASIEASRPAAPPILPAE
jgi:hypothetical protein